MVLSACSTMGDLKTEAEGDGHTHIHLCKKKKKKPCTSSDE